MNFDELISEMENDTEVVKKNVSISNVSSFPDDFDKCMHAYYENYYAAHVHSERMEFGEDLYNDAQTLNIFKSLKGTHNSYLARRKELTETTPVPLISLGIVSGDKYVFEGNRLKGEGLKNNDLLSYETGCWYLYCCQQ